MTTPNEKLLSQFTFSGKHISTEPIIAGHINNTFLVTYENTKYTLQRINTNVFKDPYKLMSNIQGVTKFIHDKIIREGGNPDRSILRVVETIDGQPLYKDEDGDFWRAYVYIDNAKAYDIVENPNLFYEAGVILGKFQKFLADYPIDTLYDTIPDFHNTPKRFDNLVKAIEKNASGRADECKEEIDFVLSRKKYCPIIVDLMNEGKIPLRVTHNDTKLNNVLIDNETKKALCLLDLDTVMPGSALYDFGDSIRFGASSALEDERDLSKVYMVNELFEAYTDGYLSQVKNSLTKDEIDNLAMSAIIITLEIGMRFLTDHLDGDVYFQIHRENHNLDRARTQFKLVADMEGKYDEMVRIVNRISSKY